MLDVWKLSLEPSGTLGRWESGASSGLIVLVTHGRSWTRLISHPFQILPNDGREMAPASDPSVGKALPPSSRAFVGSIMVRLRAVNATTALRAACAAAVSS
eukprot:4845154-Prymnesium_polylepis.1